MVNRLLHYIPATLLTLCLAAPVHSQASTVASTESNLITFGSCLRQWQPQPVWQAVSALTPKAFVFLGDNMYSDTGKYTQQAEPQRIGLAYADLSATSDFKNFLLATEKQDIDIFATWDDHDYGINDGGANYPFKKEAKAYFFDFFNLTKTASGDETAPGIYQAHNISLGDLTARLILLDTRSFRSPLHNDPQNSQCAKTNIVPNNNPEATILGEQQWQWLQEQLSQDVDLTIIASSIQVIPEQHCFEKWANFPRERQRLFDLIKSTKAKGVVLISGDRHLAEISMLPKEIVGYPLYEITASGLNSAMGLSRSFSTETNKHRLGETFFLDNFGAIQYAPAEKTVSLLIYNADGGVERNVKINLTDIYPNP